MLQHEIVIDKLNMDEVQHLINAVNDLRFKSTNADEIKALDEIRHKLERWQNALTLAEYIRVTF